MRLGRHPRPLVGPQMVEHERREPAIQAPGSVRKVRAGSQVEADRQARSLCLAPTARGSRGVVWSFVLRLGVTPGSRSPGSGHASCRASSSPVASQWFIESSQNAIAARNESSVNRSMKALPASPIAV